MHPTGDVPPWHLVLEACLVPVAMTDASGRVLCTSSDFRRLLDHDALQGQLAPVVDALPARRPAVRWPPVVETLVVGRSGQELRCRARGVFRGDGSLGWCLLHVDDPEAEARDPLTGLAGRALLVERLRQALAHQDRHGGELDVVVLDLDDFKRVNDRHGHVVGDQLLVEVARRLRSAARPEDTVCRWGGDEFVLLLADVGAADTEAVRERVEQALHDPFRLHDDLVLHVSASSGSVRVTAGADPVELMHAADMAMYARKRSRAGGSADRAALTARLERARTRARSLHDALQATMRGSEQRPPVASPRTPQD